ncbi:MAG: ZIP family metal transporter [Candidatus Aenigmarchaeota archaeon]|nr:ZIP family metal transporter [Candidatus Aenigmarchaeota archaeon]
MIDFFYILVIVALGPLIGSAIGVLKRPSQRFMLNMLSFAAGVMLAISFLELIPESIALSSVWFAAIGVFAGSVVMYVLDKSLPHIHPELCSQEQGCKLKRTAVYLMIGIFLHNFPEGMAIALGDVATTTSLTLIIALAIAIHDIPEAICTSAPYYHCTKKRLKAFLLSSSTMIPTFIGFIIGKILFGIIPLSVVGIIIAATAGIMIYISADELIPASCVQKSDHGTIFSLIIGILFVMFLGYIGI